MTSQALLFLLGCIALSILFIITLAVGVRERGKLRARLVSLAGQLAQKEAHLARAQEELRRATTRTVPMEPRRTFASEAKKIANRASAVARPSTSRTSTSDPVIDTAIGATFATWAGMTDSNNSPSCDTSSSSSYSDSGSSSSSSDGGSCGGGE